MNEEAAAAARRVEAEPNAEVSSATDPGRSQGSAFFPGKPYVNRGISGQITGQMLGRMNADVLDLKPAAVLTCTGRVG